MVRGEKPECVGKNTRNTKKNEKHTRFHTFSKTIVSAYSGELSAYFDETAAYFSVPGFGPCFHVLLHCFFLARAFGPPVMSSDSLVRGSNILRSATMSLENDPKYQELQREKERLLVPRLTLQTPEFQADLLSRFYLVISCMLSSVAEALRLQKGKGLGRRDLSLVPNKIPQVVLEEPEKSRDVTPEAKETHEDLPKQKAVVPAPEAPEAGAEAPEPAPEAPEPAPEALEPAPQVVPVEGAVEGADTSLAEVAPVAAINVDGPKSPKVVAETAASPFGKAWAAALEATGSQPETW